MEDLYTENHKTLMKERKEDINEKTSLIHELDDLILLSWQYYPCIPQNQCNPYKYKVP